MRWLPALPRTVRLGPLFVVVDEGEGFVGSQNVVAIGARLCPSPLPQEPAEQDNRVSLFIRMEER